MPATNWNDYFYPGSNVLQNQAGIKDQRKLDSFEREVTALRLAELRQDPVKPTFDLMHLQQIHRRTFQDVYSWAGEIRQVNITKGPQHDLTRFTRVEDIDKLGADIASLIKAGNNLRGLEKKDFAAEMGAVYGAVNTLHPFREGNGRATREFMTQLAEGAGYKLDFKAVSRELWNEAAIESSRGRYGLIEEVFTTISTSARAHAFDTMQRSEALAKYPELDGAYKKLHEARGADIATVQERLSRELHTGRVVDGGVTPSESLRIIEHSAKARGLEIGKSGELGQIHTGEVIARSSRHMLLQTEPGKAVAIERRALGQQIEVGERVRIQLRPAERSQEVTKGQSLDQAPAKTQAPSQAQAQALKVGTQMTREAGAR
ncbi:cell filamentation protein Fic [Pelomonas sp. HMWF004]|nr:cell filamentation protein Fic [Pelomonas sp. HMWF004]